MLRATLLASIIALPLATTVVATNSWADAGGQPPSPEVAKARAAIKTLAENLRGELMGAMKTGGPAAAVEKCKTVAPGIARDASATADGFLVGRTALKVRNPQNKPDAFEKKVLEDFAAKLKAGADPATLDHVEEVTQNGATLVRYMKAIPMAETPCVICHGTADKLSPEAVAEVKKHYPADEATGFAPGELRGAFTVTMKKK